jgi:uncharacterized protein (TIGR03437 family)
MKCGAKVALLVSLWIYSGPAWAQSAGPTATPSSLNFAYQVNSTTLPAAGKVTVSLPASTSSNVTLAVATGALPGWLTVTPDSGHAPLALSVTVNPTGLTPGSYVGTITINTNPAGSNPAAVSVTLSISNPPSTLVVTSPSGNYAPAASGASSPTLTFTYTTGSNATLPGTSELDVASNGGIIQFNVTTTVTSSKGGSSSSSAASGVWLRVSQGANQIPSTSTSGVALSGSYVPLTVTLDMATVTSLDPGSYGGTVTVAAVNTANGSATVSVNLVVSAGPPTLTTIFPASVIAGPTVDPVITINGDNFFSTSVVSLQLGGNPPITLPSQLLSRKVLQATIKAAYLAAPVGVVSYPIVWTLAVTNPAPPNNPAQTPAVLPFLVTDPTLPTISAIVNAASYSTRSVWTGTAGADPVGAAATSVSPREIISIFGQNLGPAIPSTAAPSGTPALYPVTLGGIRVWFQYGTSPVVSLPAPIIMVSSNQINAIVPSQVAAVIGTGNNPISVQILNGGISTAPFGVTVVEEDPGLFTVGGLGQGQAAVLNFDATTGSYVINSAKNAAARGSTISIYATGMGDLDPTAAVQDGAVATSAVKLSDSTARVDIDGQPGVVTYAGSSPGAVAGLVQINAIVPPTVKTGQAISITVSMGGATKSRRSQPGVTLAVK